MLKRPIVSPAKTCSAEECMHAGTCPADACSSIGISCYSCGPSPDRSQYIIPRPRLYSVRHYSSVGSRDALSISDARGYARHRWPLCGAYTWCAVRGPANASFILVRRCDVSSQSPMSICGLSRKTLVIAWDGCIPGCELHVSASTRMVLALHGQGSVSRRSLQHLDLILHPFAVA